MSGSQALTGLSDLASQPKSVARWVLHRLSRGSAPNDLQDPKRHANFAHMLRKHLINAWRITKPANRDITSCVVRELEDDEDDIDAGGLGRFILLDIVVAPDHATEDAHFGPRAFKCEVVFCMGRPHNENDPDALYFPFCMTRGRMALVKAFLDWMNVQFHIKGDTVDISSDHLSYMASQWTRVGPSMFMAEDGTNSNKRRNLRSSESKLEIVFQLPSTPGVEPATVHVQVEEESLKALHGVVLKDNDDEQENNDDEEEDENHHSGTSSMAIRALTSHLHKHLAVDLQGALVVAIVTPVAELDRMGRIRFFWPRMLRSAMHSMAETVFKG